MPICPFLAEIGIGGGWTLQVRLIGHGVQTLFPTLLLCLNVHSVLVFLGLVYIITRLIDYRAKQSKITSTTFLSTLQSPSM